MSVNIKDISEKTGYSVATVSRVLNHSGSVSTTTYDSVMKVINELGYVPNTLGRNLRTLKTNIVLVIVPSMRNPFYSGIVSGIEEKAEWNGYTVLVCDTNHSYEKLKAYFEFIPQKQVDGIIYISPQGHEDHSFLKGLPVVVCCESRADIPALQVDIDNVKAGFDATMHLIAQGRRRIALIGGGIESASGLKREEGYRRALKSAGIPIDESIVLKRYYEYKGGELAARHLFGLQNPPDAVFAISDTAAVGVINEAQVRNISIPEELMVVGFDNLDLSKMVNPTLTTVKQPCHEMGQSAMTLLLRLLNGESGKNIQCPHELIERKSTHL